MSFWENWSDGKKWGMGIASTLIISVIIFLTNKIFTSDEANDNSTHAGLWISEHPFSESVILDLHETKASCLSMGIGKCFPFNGETFACAETTQFSRQDRQKSYSTNPHLVQCFRSLQNCITVTEEALESSRFVRICDILTFSQAKKLFDFHKQKILR